MLMLQKKKTKKKQLSFSFSIFPITFECDFDMHKLFDMGQWLPSPTGNMAENHGLRVGSTDSHPGCLTLDRQVFRVCLHQRGHVSQIHEFCKILSPFIDYVPRDFPRSAGRVQSPISPLFVRNNHKQKNNQSLLIAKPKKIICFTKVVVPPRHHACAVQFRQLLGSFCDKIIKCVVEVLPSVPSACHHPLLFLLLMNQKVVKWR